MHDYENEDICWIYDFRDSPPPDWFFRLSKPEPNPFNETILRKLGNTWYVISTVCDGAESLTDKVKRLIFTDPVPEKAVPQG